MQCYEGLYYQLFNSITDALSALENGCHGLAKEILIKAQQNTEENYTSSGQ